MGEDFAGIFAELGRRLARFGDDLSTASIVQRAAAANPWFLPCEIELAARNIAENMLSDDVLRTWIAGYPALPAAEPKNILVVMAGNIPFVGFHDLLCVLASGHRAVVKPSSKDAVLMYYAVDELLDIAPELPISIYSGSEALDAVVAMGGDNTVRALRERYAGVPVLLRGNRWSLAVLDGTETMENLAGLGGDILSYSGLGCRNVSLVFVPRNYDINILKNALFARAAGVNPKYLNNYRQVKALLELNSVPYIDCGVNALVEAREFSPDVSRINYAFYDSLYEVKDWMSEHDCEIQCIVGKTTHPRAVGFGKTQQPGLTDYPDGRDTMKFLAGI